MKQMISRWATTRFAIVVLVLCVLVGGYQWKTAWGEQPTATSPVSESQLATTLASNPDFFLPAHDAKAEIVHHDYYTLNYQNKYEQAGWVAYELTTAMLVKKANRDKSRFKADPTVPSGSATPADYKGSGFDQGHLKPAADASFSQAAMDETFYMSNMSPQRPAFNRGIWGKLEDRVRGWATRNKTVYVVTGPIITDPAQTIGANKVAVPQAYYKVVLDFTLPEIKGIGFILPNEKSSQPLDSFACPIDKVEETTKIDFFPNLPDELETKVESNKAFAVWFVK
ncbi:MAG: DNA/RNA non-specific endonuclease [Armatimonadota bacterium]